MSEPAPDSIGTVSKDGKSLAELSFEFMDVRCVLSLKAAIMVGGE